MFADVTGWPPRAADRVRRTGHSRRGTSNAGGCDGVRLGRGRGRSTVPIGHEVAIIDRDSCLQSAQPAAGWRAGVVSFDQMCCCVGIQGVDAFAAVSGDNSNIISARRVREPSVCCVVARIYDAKRAEEFMSDSASPPLLPFPDHRSAAQRANAGRRNRQGRDPTGTVAVADASSYTKTGGHRATDLEQATGAGLRFSIRFGTGIAWNRRRS